jgi:hypothetical protein
MCIVGYCFDANLRHRLLARQRAERFLLDDLHCLVLWLALGASRRFWFWGCDRLRNKFGNVILVHDDRLCIPRRHRLPKTGLLFVLLPFRHYHHEVGRMFLSTIGLESKRGCLEHDRRL